MGLYERLEEHFTEKQINEYERIIKEINKHYDEFKSIYKNTTYINDVSERILLDGTPSLDYYLNDLINSGVMNEEITSLISTVQDHNNTVKKSEGVIDSIINKFSVLQKNLSYVEKVDYLKKLVKLNPNILNDSKTKAILYLLSTEVFESSKYELNSYNEEIIKKMQSGKTKLESIYEIMSENNIELNLNGLLITLKSEYKRNLYSIESELKDKIVANSFIVNTNKLKQYVSKKIASGENVEDILKEILPEAYGLVKAACEYAIQKTPYDVQLMGAIALNEGKATEMYTGEGKTITAILPAYLNALTGSRVDIFSANDYLAVRDAESNKKVFNVLGLTVGSIKIDGQTLTEKQNEYSKDIVYGSATAFAFDFLYDTNASSKEEINRQNHSGGFVVVDEADQVLINNALNPFQLKDTSRKLTQKQKEENSDVISYLNEANSLQKLLSKSSYTARNKYEYECITGDNKVETERLGEKYSLLIGPNDIYITPKGERELFYEVMYDKIFDFSCKAKEYFLNNGLYEENKDYIIRDEHLVLTTNGLEKATKEISEFQKMELDWLTNEKNSTLRLYLRNALTAEYILKKGENYQVIPDDKGIDRIYVLQDGRVIPNSKYMKGLHQALEIKEGLEVQLDDEEYLLDDTLSSISIRALLSKYDKISAMTGTADKLAFREIYKLDTVEIPKNKDYLYQKGRIQTPPGVRKDNPLKFYQTKKEKLSAIIKDIESCNKKGQPVLVVTNNEEDAIELHNLLRLKSNLLISTKTLEEEAKIVSEAGSVGAITIGTEMAGRGTDIILGGSRENLKKYVLDLETSRLVIKKNIGIDLGPTDSNVLEILDFITENPNIPFVREAKELTYKKYETSQEFMEHVNKSIEKYSKKFSEKLNSLGGLKYIQMNPFKTTRNDKQGRGRVARQGDNGETITYACKEDLVKIGVDRDELKYIDEITKDNSSPTFIIEEIIEKAQSINEYGFDTQIAMSDGMDFAMSSLGMSILNKRLNALVEDNISDQFFGAVDSTINTIFKESTPVNKKKKLDDSLAKVERLHIDFDKVNRELQSCFGIQIKTKDIINLKTVKDVKTHINNMVYTRYEETIKGVPIEKQNNKIRGTLVSELNAAYNSFIDSSENIKLQEMNDLLVLNGSHNRIIDLNGIYDDIMSDTYKKCVRNIFKPYIRENNISEEHFYKTELESSELPTIEELNKKSRT